jgi:hypothetical protein
MLKGPSAGAASGANNHRRADECCVSERTPDRSIRRGRRISSANSGKENDEAGRCPCRVCAAARELGRANVDAGATPWVCRCYTNGLDDGPFCWAGAEAAAGKRNKLRDRHLAVRVDRPNGRASPQTSRQSTIPGGRPRQRRSSPSSRSAGGEPTPASSAAVIVAKRALIPSENFRNRRVPATDEPLKWGDSDCCYVEGATTSGHGGRK